ncbi:hypothetical protein [Sphingomonas sp. SUN039]|uniref:hypothetical protein n=1 Tax=Sphingomonas sp. SUN039 TaxID=2937787 RepID=UPI0021649FBB|nr:hypothetical protein [Sphingomonas sp. SUN039]UVO54901.1 hypothetical protein M0209_12485 [Sphingomonas sp. SUN039]
MTQAETQPPVSRNILRSIISGQWQPDATGIGSTEQVIQRLVEAHNAALKESNRLFAISIGLALLYSIKVVGLRIDLVLFDQKVFELPYGLFLFCVASQLSFCIACVRFLDQRVFDRYLRAICDREWGDRSEFMYRTLKGGQEWSTTTQSLIDRPSVSIYFRTVYFLSMASMGLIYLAIFLMPIISGGYFIYDYDNQISGRYPELQYWSVIATTILSAIVMVVSLAFYNLDNDEVLRGG